MIRLVPACLLLTLLERRSEDYVLAAAVVFGKVILFVRFEAADVEIVEEDAVVDRRRLCERAAADADARVDRNRIELRSDHEDQQVASLPHVLGELVAPGVVVGGFELDRGLARVGEIGDYAPVEYLDLDFVVVLDRKSVV